MIKKYKNKTTCSGIDWLIVAPKLIKLSILMICILIMTTIKISMKINNLTKCMDKWIFMDLMIKMANNRTMMHQAMIIEENPKTKYTNR